MLLSPLLFWVVRGLEVLKDVPESLERRGRSKRRLVHVLGRDGMGWDGMGWDGVRWGTATTAATESRQGDAWCLKDRAIRQSGNSKPENGPLTSNL